jgi:hypothetical protein
MSSSINRLIINSPYEEPGCIGAMVERTVRLRCKTGEGVSDMS